MRRMLSFFLAGACFCGCGDLAPDIATSQEAARKAAVSSYRQQMIGPGAEARTYLSLYTTHKVECESGEPSQRRYSCTQAKVDLAHIERAWQQGLAIFEKGAQDAALSEQDRKESQQAAEDIRAGIQRIESAKPGKLPQL
jgi:hypothetical protein